jgi:GntR family transcriptional repressor for pyruvate dehydrogenase complex
VFNRIGKKTLTNEIIDQIVERLRSDDLHPGDRLPSELELSEQLGVGRSSVREALKALEVLGIVSRSNDGNRISNEFPLDTVSQLLAADFVTQRLEVEHVYGARRVLETHLCELAAKSVTPDDTQLLLSLCDEMEALDQTQILQYAELDRTFHRTICSLCGNPILTRMWELTYDLYVKLRLSVEITNDFLAVSNERHRRIVRALADRDPVFIRSTIEELHTLGQRDITRVLESKKKSSGAT